MRAKPTKLPDVVEVQATRHEDGRGYFAETFRLDWFASQISREEFVQDNQSLSVRAGTIRGLHAQTAPFAQGKLVSCVVGAVLDVAVDIRVGSPSFGEWVAVTLSAAEGNQLWIAPGFLHGYCTLTDKCLVAYKVTNYYSREHNDGVRWDDPDIGIAWPAVANSDHLSESDRRWPLLKDSTAHFALTRER